MKKILSVLVLAAMAAAACWFLKPWAPFIAVSGPVKPVRTTIAVLEGEVAVYKIVGGLKPEYQGILKRGDIQTIETGGTAQGGVQWSTFNLLRPLIPKAVEVFKARMNDLAPREDGGETRRVFTEDEFKKFIIPGLESSTALSDIILTIRPEGFAGSARMNFGLFRTVISGHGTAGVDPETKQMALDLYEIRVGGFKLPSFLLRQLEEVFAEAASRQELPVEIRNMEYSDQAIRISFRKR